MSKKGFIRLVFTVFILLIVIVFIIQNPALTRDVGKGIVKATGWLVKGGISVYKESNISKNINITEPILEKVK